MSKKCLENVARIKELLKQSNIPGWLFYDFRESDPIAYRVLGLHENAHITRRWFYFIPAEGEPVKLVHRIEQEKLDALPGRKNVYLRWETLEKYLARALEGCSQVAMQYSPGNAIPYVSLVDGGTIADQRQGVAQGHRQSDRFVYLITPAFEILLPGRLCGLQFGQPMG